MTTSVYALIDPRINRVRYIGKSAKPRKRLAAHLAAARSGLLSRKNVWVRSLLEQGLLPTLAVIEECHGDGATEERFHIRMCREDGLELLNDTDGGEGSGSEVAARISAILKGRKRSAESRAKQAVSVRIALANPEARAKMRAAWKKRKDAAQLAAKDSQ